MFDADNKAVKVIRLTSSCCHVKLYIDWIDRKIGYPRQGISIAVSPVNLYIITLQLEVHKILITV